MAEEAQVIACHTVQEWNEKFQKAKDSGKLIVIDFTASWCGPCRVITPYVSELAKKFPHVAFFKVDVDDLKDVAEEYKVEAMPSFVILKEGQEVERIVGARKDELLHKIAVHAPITA
uniref:Thioredoxin H-type n=1 Tax=Fagopyrum esculentum TaxID=3617 RepID=TRXH_FAGES|nr:RecName: Full=Thioredoxin H-type; Short=Trx-H [Fagopyrum esculentum]BAA13524.1 thioredoxin [Fagopyrum esculentum]